MSSEPHNVQRDHNLWLKAAGVKRPHRGHLLVYLRKVYPRPIGPGEASKVSWASKRKAEQMLEEMLRDGEVMLDPGGRWLATPPAEQDRRIATAAVWEDQG